MYPPDLKDEVCGVAEDCLDLGGRVNVSYQSQSDRIGNDTGKPSLTAEFNPTNPLEQGLGDRFFLSFIGIFGLIIKGGGRGWISGEYARVHL